MNSIEKIIKTAKENKYGSMDMIIAANTMMVEELKSKLKEKGGSISFTNSLVKPYMVFCGTEVNEVRVTKVYLDKNEEIKINGQFVDTDDTIYTLNLDDFIIGQTLNVLQVINMA